MIDVESESGCRRVGFFCNLKGDKTIEIATMGHTVAFTRPDKKASSGYYASPAAGDSAPGIVVIQEWWRVNQQIKGGERLAQALD